METGTPAHTAAANQTEESSAQQMRSNALSMKGPDTDFSELDEIST